MIPLTEVTCSLSHTNLPTYSGDLLQTVNHYKVFIICPDAFYCWDAVGQEELCDQQGASGESSDVWLGEIRSLLGSVNKAPELAFFLNAREVL